MNLHLVRIFAAVAEARNFSRAAKDLYISQPAVTKAVQELERQVGMALLDRSRRTLALTEAGALLFARAQHILAEERLAEADLAQMREGALGSLTIGASTTIGVYLLPTALGRFHTDYPGNKLFLDIGNTREILRRLRTVPLHFALVEGPVDDAELEVVAWQRDTLVVIAAANHPLVRHPNATLADALRQPFILREPGSGTREVIAQALAAQSIILTMAMELGSTEAIKRAVSAGLGLAIVSAATIADDVALGRVRVLAIPELTIPRKLWLVTAAGRPTSPAQEAFLRITRNLALFPGADELE